jgi:hypothetical protein
MEEIKKMKVKDLKKECMRRKLPTKGNKSELATRLDDHFITALYQVNLVAPNKWIQNFN